MKRDMELVREILLAVEAGSSTYGVERALHGKGYEEDLVGYHSYLLIDAGLAVGVTIGRDQNPTPHALINHLTWQGHEFLDAARDKGRWEQAKGKLAAVGGFSLPIMQRLLTDLMKAAVGLE